MIKGLLIFLMGAWFGTSLYGQPTRDWVEKYITISWKWLKKKFTVNEKIVKFNDNSHGIYCKWMGITLYKNLTYSGNDMFDKWMVRSDDQFNHKCKSTMDKCKSMLNVDVDKVTEVDSTK